MKKPSSLTEDGIQNLLSFGSTGEKSVLFNK